MDLIPPTANNYVSTDTHSDTPTYPILRTLVFPMTTGSQNPASLRPRQCLLTAQIWCRAYCKAPVWSHRLRGQGQRDTHGGFAFCLKSNLLGNTLRSKGWERLCGQDVVDDLMIPAYCGKEGVIERGPRSISHKVSVGSASKHLRKATVQHSE